MDHVNSKVKEKAIENIHFWANIKKISLTV